MKINEIITENDELYEWVPLAVGAARVLGGVILKHLAKKGVKGTATQQAKQQKQPTITQTKPTKKTALSKQITKSIKLNKTTSKPNPHADTNKIGLGRSNNVNKAFADKTRLDNFRARYGMSDKYSAMQKYELQKLQKAAKVSGSKVSPKVLK
jgi:hypothetical protein